MNSPVRSPCFILSRWQGIMGFLVFSPPRYAVLVLNAMWLFSILRTCPRYAVPVRDTMCLFSICCACPRYAVPVQQTPAAASYYRHVTQKFHGNRIFISRMLNRNPKRLSAEVFSSAQKQPKQNANSQNREENGSTTLRNTREKPLLAG